jgi:hypothetical protein
MSLSTFAETAVQFQPLLYTYLHSRQKLARPRLQNEKVKQNKQFSKVTRVLEGFEAVLALTTFSKHFFLWKSLHNVIHPVVEAACGS